MHFLLLLLTLILTGCSSLEHRPDMLPKKKIAKLENKINIEPLWNVQHSIGFKGKNSKLLIAEYDNKFLTADSAGHLNMIDDLGNLIWQKETNMPISAGPIIEKNLIVVGTHDAKLAAFAVDNGKLIWESNVTGEILATPTVKDGVVYVHTLDGKISAHNCDTGVRIWQHSTNPPTLVLRKSSSPVVAQDKILVGSASGSVLSLEKDTGAVNWEQKLGFVRGMNDIQRMKDISADVIVSDGKIFAISFQGNLVALSTDTGYTLWTKNISSFIGMIKHENNLYIADNQGYIWCVDVEQGLVKWKQQDLQGRFLSKPALYKNYIAVGDDDGFLYLLSKEDGELVSKIKIDKHAIETQPMVKKDNIVLYSTGGSLAAYKII